MANILTRIGKTIRSWITDQSLGSNVIPGSQLWLGSPTAAGLYLTPEQSLTYTAVVAGIDILSSALGTVRFNVVRNIPGGGKVIAEDHPLQWIVAYDANEEISAKQLQATIVIHLIVYGNCYIEIERDEMLRPVALWVLPHHDVEVVLRPGLPLAYKVRGEVMLNRDIIHLSTASLNGLVGVSPLQHCRDAVGVGKALEIFASSFFANGLNAKGVVTIPDGMDEVQAENLRKSIMAMHGGAYQGNKLLVLEEGATFTSTATQPNEAQMVEARAFQVLEICRCLRLAPQKLQDYSHSGLTSVEEINIDFYQTSLLPYIDKIEDQFCRKLIPPQQRRLYTIEHDRESLLRGRQADQVDVWQKLQSMGVLNTNEVRGKIGLPPIENGDVYMVPANNYQPLSLVVMGQTPAAPEPEKELDAPEPQKQLPAPMTSDRSHDETMREAAREAVLEVARRMVRRETNAVRKLLKKGSLEAVLEGLSDHYKGEAALLSEAYSPALRIYSLASNQDLDARTFASQIVEQTQLEILQAVEGPNTLEVLNELVEQWETEKAIKICSLLGNA